LALHKSFLHLPNNSQNIPISKSKLLCIRCCVENIIFVVMPLIYQIRFFITCITLLSFINTTAQTNGHSNIAFYHLSTQSGITDNYINDMCNDKTDNLWVGTGEGLNMFNGKTVTKFFRQQYPVLQNDFIVQIVCDPENRVWILTDLGNVTMIDAHREFHRVGLYKKNEFIKTRRILFSNEKIILFTGDGHYALQDLIPLGKHDSLTFKNFIALPITHFDSIYKKEWKQIEKLDSINYIFLDDRSFCIVNYQQRTISKKVNLNSSFFLTAWSVHELLFFDQKILKPFLYNLHSGLISYPFDTVKDQYGNVFSGVCNNAKKIDDRRLLITTRKNGIYIYDLISKKLSNYKHNAADPSSIINNSLNIICVNNSGWVFIGGMPNGLSYFKTTAVIGQQLIFQDKKSKSYDGFINTIASTNNDDYLIGAGENLIRWKRSTNQTTFLNDPQITTASFTYIAYDSAGNAWIGTVDNGIYVVDKNSKLIKHLVNALSDSILPGNSIKHIAFDKNIAWISTSSGIGGIDCKKLTKINVDKSLQLLSRYPSMFMYKQDADNLWIGTTGYGAFRYNFTAKTLQNFKESTGITSDNVFCFNKDRDNNVYMGTGKGLSILLATGKIKNIRVADGLLNKRVEALLLDKNNRMWMGNDVGLACYSIKDSSLKVFDERYGLSVEGFRINAYHQNTDDELIWGTEKGIQYFYPDKLLNQKAEVPAVITRIETRDIQADLSLSDTFNLGVNDNYVTFYFSSIDYTHHLRTFYQYKLEGLDKTWINVVDQNYVRYSSLAPGKYVFKVRVSNDNKQWKDARNMVSVNIAMSFWKTLWFKIFSLLMAIVMLGIVINYYRRKQMHQKEELESEMVISYFATSINSLQKTDEILWDVTRNCISQLQFEDCVIYMLDEEKNILVQKAAWGPKMKSDYTIHQPIEISVGKGIVGSAVLLGEAQLVNDTSLDKRYLIDDAIRLSELSVPIFLNGKVIGVIDSEHSHKNFFKQKHLNILTTIAVLCANHLERAKAEEEKQQARIEILEQKQKVTDFRLQSLRLQMNPHFLFNALNSIQQMILANEDMVATKYLSRFSRLLRSILVHSDKDTISLKEELEILKLYVELESGRFKDAFKYEIICAPNIDTDEIMLPTLLIQPFVENAIWHGLMHKEGLRKLVIQFFEKDNMLSCIIEDNGTGRQNKNVTQILNGQPRTHTSKGIKVSEERLKNLGKTKGKEGELRIIDLKNEDGSAGGTRVEINFPI